jgi:tRNA dimethylallyltransferase
VTQQKAGDSQPVIVVFGPTAGGKSALALALAERLDGVVINADSLQVYAELEILTARPGPEATARAPHRLDGVLPAATAGSAAWWRDAALAEIAAAHAAGRRAILTGGTGLYINTLIAGLSPIPPADEAARAKATELYAELGGEAFRDVLARRDPEAAQRLMAGDRQRLIRAWEVAESTGKPLSDWQKLPREPGHSLDFRLIGLMPPREELYRRIDRRFETMMSSGALEEARAFAALGLPASLPANKALGLPELRQHLNGEIDLPEAVRAAQQASRNYAKRQMTWFRGQLPPDKKSLILHGWDAEIGELSESFLSEIMPFILRPG